MNVTPELIRLYRAIGKAVDDTEKWEAHYYAMQPDEREKVDDLLETLTSAGDELSHFIRCEMGVAIEVWH